MPTSRLQLGTCEKPNSALSAGKVEQALLSGTGSGATRQMFFVPLHYEQNYAYPLLVWLHGPGDDERQLQRLMPLVSMRNYVAVGPRGSARYESGGYSWQQTESGIAAAEQSVFAAVEAAQERFNVAPERIFVGGYASGGTMAFRVALRHPAAFAGALSIGGPFPSGHMPLAQLQQLRSLPLFIAQGRDAVDYPVEQACQELRLFHAAGLKATLRQYPCGDEVTTVMLHDMDVWMMERVTGIESSPAGECLLPPGEAN